MRHRSRPTQDDFILSPEGILHHTVYVEKGTANAIHKWHKLYWATKRAAIFKFADSDCIGGKEFVNRFCLAFVPNLLESAAH